jgi:hypothetical protein
MTGLTGPGASINPDQRREHNERHDPRLQQRDEVSRAAGGYPGVATARS